MRNSPNRQKPLAYLDIIALVIVTALAEQSMMYNAVYV